ncbi:YheC/YheD family protein [Paenibacillus roseipurpureus]|uniref:YheC/YheD family protein n=1 Tax=Paenibacillus roseopurpureus TaxID=2918901 RepID=A0AA96LX01_9BACL|nr:YheC/YheD family protein [Paenibacillus sp. MBLB1832]WNR46210.1 YheC/YheD family protein [Paenibacillus sp. MBLB1832]
MAAKYKSHSIRSKWRKTKWLLKQPNLRRYVPRTLLFTRSHLNTMLASYSTVFFKPTGGSGGNHIIKITKKSGSGGYHTQLNRKRSFHKSVDQLHRYLVSFARGRSFLLQKGISLAKTRGRPFDIRVMVQKSNAGKWISTALFAKIGKLGKVATNYNQGGTVGYFHHTLQGAGYSVARSRQKERSLNWLGVEVGKNFDRNYKGFRELGLDVALDHHGRPWILEVNTRPQFYPLKHMSNRSLYQRMLKSGKQYGRTR